MNWLSRIFSVSGTDSTSKLYFFNTLGHALQEFKMPAGTRQVRMYNCGPTVYDRQHIGNLSAAVFADTIRRTLEHNGYSVKQVINITDFGHLVSDGDDGEDKMTKGLKREKKALTMENMRDFATKYMDIYLEDIKTLNVATDKIEFPRASDHVQTMIAMIETLMEKGYAYVIKDGVYFDTMRFPGYGNLGGNLEGQEAGARVGVNSDKKSPHDFALWKSIPARSKLGWVAPWGRGFPGWHLECSAMINAILGKQIDIHTGGIEHVAIHHNNEIAQSEAVTGKKPLSRFWMHREHIRMGDAKLAKSTGNTAYLSDVTEKGFHPIALRYWFLTAHYRTPSNFTWDALHGAQQALTRLHQKAHAVRDIAVEPLPAKFKREFTARINDDLDTPGAIAVLWESLKDTSITPGEMHAMLICTDTVLALGLFDDSISKAFLSATESIAVSELPAEIQDMLTQRDTARKDKDWVRSDELRKQIDDAGYSVEDKPEGQRVVRK